MADDESSTDDVIEELTGESPDTPSETEQESETEETEPEESETEEVTETPETDEEEEFDDVELEVESEPESEEIEEEVLSEEDLEGELQDSGENDEDGEDDEVDKGEDDEEGSSEDDDEGFISKLFGDDEEEELSKEADVYEYEDKSFFERVMEASGLRDEEFEMEYKIGQEEITEDDFVPPTDKDLVSMAIDNLAENGPERPERMTDPEELPEHVDAEDVNSVWDYDEEEVRQFLADDGYAIELVRQTQQELKSRAEEIEEIVQYNIHTEDAEDVDEIDEYGLTIEDYRASMDDGFFVLGGEQILRNLAIQWELNEVEYEFLCEVHSLSSQTVQLHAENLITTTIYIPYDN